MAVVDATHDSSTILECSIVDHSSCQCLSTAKIDVVVECAPMCHDVTKKEKKDGRTRTLASYEPD